jgi:four helix bundle protein
MNSARGDKPYDLEQRTFQFARESRIFVKQLPRTIANLEDVRQLIRASGSIGANYIEANECIGKKDFVMKIKTCRREAKESAYWLRLLDCNGRLDHQRSELASEALELMKILARSSESLTGEFLDSKLFGTSIFEFRISVFQEFAWLPSPCRPLRTTASTYIF